MTEITKAVFVVINSLVIILATVIIFLMELSRHKRSVGYPLITIPNASIASSSSSTSTSQSSPSVPASSSRSWKYDVFLSFRGEDTRKTFVDHLYSALQRRLVRTYKDDEALPRGDTVGPSLLNAIDGSQIALIIFSENYSDSSWCLDELEYIMKGNKERGQIVMPVFYHVDPTDLRKQKGKYGEPFAKHKSDNNNKVESWRKALVDASNIAGWETKHIANGHEAKGIEDIVGKILDKLLSLNSVVDKNLVGMGTRLQDLKSRLQIGSGGVRMIGIWGIGGGGKTTLATSLYMEIRSNFDSSCFIGNIKQKSSKLGLESLQKKILSTLFDKELKVESVDIGKITLEKMLRCRNVLIVLDDVDDCEQLEVLAGSHDWFGNGSRIIITSRDEHLLITHRVDEIVHVCLLSNEEAIRLFYRRAYNENIPVEDYKTLSQRVISYAGGLPLALTVLGSFLYDKNKEEWISTLNRLKDIPEREIVKILKISFDGLKSDEKELFLDIACFFLRESTNLAMVVFDACGFHPRIGVKVLIQKSLITIDSDGEFNMHDLVQGMGHYIVRGEHPYNPEKHSRLWRYKEIEYECNWNALTKNDKTEALMCRRCPSNLHKLVSNAKKLRLLSIYNSDKVDIKVPYYLSNELRYMLWERYPASLFPESFKLKKLVVLRLNDSLQEELWSGYKSLLCLKELRLSSAPNLVRTPDFGGLPYLQKLKLKNCDKLKEIHPSLGNHKSLVKVYVKNCNKLEEFPVIVQMGKLEILELSYCDALHTFPTIESNMDSLRNLSLKHVAIKVLPSTVGEYCTNLRLLKLEHCLELKSIECKFHALKHLQKCKIRGGCKKSMNLPKDLFNENICLKEFQLCGTRPSFVPPLPRFLRRLILSKCGLEDGEIPCDIGALSSLQELVLSWNNFSRLNFSLSQLSQLKLLDLTGCKYLVELPELPTSIAILIADTCQSLEAAGDINTDCKWLCQVSFLNVRSVSGWDRLLQTMLQGNAIENGCMSLQLGGLEIPKELIIPRLLKGRIFRLQVPENWYNHFSGFLICAVVKGDRYIGQRISIKHDDGGSTNMDSQQNVYWEETVDDVEIWVAYVSFGSLKHTLWWNSTSTAIEFSLEKKVFEPESSCSGFGVSLVSKTSQSEPPPPTPPTDSSKSSDDFTRYYSIQHDSKSDLKVKFNSNIYKW